MRARGRKLVELAPVGFHDGGSCFPCHGGQPCKGAVGFSGGDVKLVDGTACGKRLLYGVAALQHIFGGLRRLLRTAGRRAAVVLTIHRKFTCRCRFFLVNARRV